MPIFEKKDNKKFFREKLNNWSLELEKEILSRLKRMADEGYALAIREAGYENRTGNLQSSIGAIVSKDGKEVYRAGFNTILKGSEGKSKGIALATKYMPRVGYGLVYVAGEHYSFFVENLYGLNVLAATEIYMKTEFRNFLSKIR